MVKAVETCGSGDGKTSHNVMIADCGQLPPGGGVPGTEPGAGAEKN